MSTLAAGKYSVTTPVYADQSEIPVRVGSDGSLLVSVSSGGGGTQYAEDAAAANGDTGTVTLVKRVDTATTQTTTDGDYTVPVANANGQLRVGINRTFQSSDADSILKAEDAAHTTGDAGVMALAVRNDTAAALATTTADYIPLTTDANGALWVSSATLLAGENLTTNRLNNEPIYSFSNITTNTTTTVKSGAGTLHGFTVNNTGFTTAGTITIYDNTAGSGTKVGTWTIPISPPGSTLLATIFIPPAVALDASFGTGLTFVTATTAPAADITVLYR